MTMRFFPLLFPSFSAAIYPVSLIRTRPERCQAALLVLFGLAVSLAGSAPMASAQGVTFTGSQAVNFGRVNVCPSGQTAPAPCSNTLTLTYKVTGSGTLGAPLALTTGAPNFDFTLAGGSTCTGSVTVGNTCTVNVAFAPLAPGVRKGAVEILDGSGNMLANTYIYGNGAAVGPAIAFNPAAQRSFLGVGGYALAVEASGDVFVGTGNSNNPVLEILAVHGSIPANPTVNTLGSGGINSAAGVAVDGSGDVFVVDSGDSGDVKEILAVNGSIPANPAVKTLASGFYTPIAVEGSGNVFVTVTSISQYTGIPSGAVQEILAINGGIPANPTIKTLSSDFIVPNGIAVDGSGNVFVSDRGGQFTFATYPAAVKEILAVDGSIPANPTVKTLGSGISGSGGLYGVAVDAGGNVFFTNYGVVYEILAAGGYTTVNTFGVTGNSTGVAVDGNGNVFLLVSSFGDDILELKRSQPGPLSFAPTTPGYTSIDSPQPVQIQNIGNANLIGTVPSVSLNWDLVAGSGTPEDCTASFSLTPGTECNLSISFEPTEDGPLTGAVTLEDNALNTTSTTQSIQLSGTGAAPSITSLSANYGALYAIITVTGANFGASQGSRTVTFNGVPATAYGWSNTSFTVIVPGGATSGNIVVTANGQASNGVAFTVEPTPSVTGIDPTSGPVGTVVAISGQNLLDAEGHGTVYLNAIRLPILNQSSTGIQVEVPPGAISGAFDVHINGVGSYTPIFTVPGTPATPEIMGISAYYGAWYAIITLTGTSFGTSQGSSAVTFNLPATTFSVTAVPTAWSNTSITLPVPYRAGNGDILVNPAINNIVVTVGGRASNGFAFTVEPTPSLSGMSPTSGPAGTVVTITGQNLLDAGGRGKVFFNGTSLPILNPSDTSIQVDVPAGATSGVFDVHINGVGNYTPAFTVSN